MSAEEVLIVIAVVSVLFAILAWSAYFALLAYGHLRAWWQDRQNVPRWTSEGYRKGHIRRLDRWK